MGLDRFAKITLSSLYLDITKDILYADLPDSLSRQGILWVMNEVNVSSITTYHGTHYVSDLYLKVLRTMTMIVAPILPHLSEEIHHHTLLQDGSKRSVSKSVFTEGWRPVVSKSKLFNLATLIERTRTTLGTTENYQRI